MNLGSVVVDTNVPIVANGRDTNVDEPCQLCCVTKIQEIRSCGTVILDDRNLILDEYANRLNFSGEPGVGDAFFKYVFDHSYSGSRVLRVSITATSDDQRGFEELPKNDLDRSDRKFLAAAVVANAPILNATDSDWDEQRTLLDRLSVTVEQLCPHLAIRSR